MNRSCLQTDDQPVRQWWWSYLPLVLLGGWLRWHQCSLLAVCGSDVGEYVYCVEHNQLPHSPYIGFLWIGYLLKPFLPLDLGYTLVSLAVSLVTLVLFGQVVAAITRNKAAGWAAALVLTLTPVAIRFGSYQEVYAVLLFWLVCSWYAIWNLRSPFLAGLFMGCALITHNGVVFAIPASLLLFIQAHDPEVLTAARVRSMVVRVFDGIGQTWRHLKNPSDRERIALALEPGCQHLFEREERSLFEIFRAAARGIRTIGLVCWQKQRVWTLVCLGLMVPVLLAGGWLLVIWLEANGIFGIFRIRHFLRGAAPGPDWAKAFGSDAFSFWWGQIVRIWTENSHTGAFGKWTLIAGGVGLFFSPLSRSMAWWLLPVPYLLYESTIGYTLDYGIYLVFLAPSIAWGISIGVKALGQRVSGIASWVRLMASIVGILSLVLITPDFYGQGTLRQLYPWHRPTGANKALSDFVRQHSRADTLVIQPLEWHFSGLTIALYTDRIPLFRDSGTILLPGHWKPLFNHPKFHSFRYVTTEDFEKWLSMDRPIVSFDADPFHTWAALWPKLETDRYETRPILWLDRNQGGSSEPWRDVRILTQAEIGNASSEQRVQFQHDPQASGALLELELYRPTLYRIARKIDPPENPPWAIDLQSLVPENQRIPSPTLKRHGIAVEAGMEPISMVLPSEPGKNHILSILIQSRGWDYVIECQVNKGGAWVTVDRDMEKIVGNPDYYFTELYFQVPSQAITGDSIEVRLVPAFGTPAVNVYGVEWGVRKG